jgi:hypothetical protein
LLVQRRHLGGKWLNVLHWRYARCWWHFTLLIINIEKNVSRLLFHFFFLICVYIPWVWLGWRWCRCVLMYCSLFRNFTFCFYRFLFYFGSSCIYLCCWCFPLGVYFNVCLLFISFVFPFSIYILFVLYDCTLSFFLWKYILL